MMTYPQRKRLFDAVPTSFSVEGPQATRTFSGVAKRYVNQFDDTTPMPAIVLQYTAYSQAIWEPLQQTRKFTTRTTDTITKQTGVNVYSLSVTPAIAKVDEIFEVRGTVGGVKNRIIASVNYTLDSVLNQITFVGPTFPDDTTTFTVLYNHWLFRQVKGEEEIDTLSVNVYTEDYTDITVSPSKFYPGIVIAEQIAVALQKFFAYTFADTLLEFITYPVGEFSQIKDLDFLVEPSQWRRRRQFDVRVHHAVEVEETGETVEIVDEPGMTVQFNG